MIRRELVFNYFGILLTTLASLGSYLLLSYLLKKTKLSKRKRTLIIAIAIILIFTVSFLSKSLFYKEICGEIHTGGEICSKKLPDLF